MQRRTSTRASLAGRSRSLFPCLSIPLRHPSPRSASCSTPISAGELSCRSVTAPPMLHAVPLITLSCSSSQTREGVKAYLCETAAARSALWQVQLLRLRDQVFGHQGVIVRSPHSSTPPLSWLIVLSDLRFVIHRIGSSASSQTRRTPSARCSDSCPLWRQSIKQSATSWGSVLRAATFHLVCLIAVSRRSHLKQTLSCFRDSEADRGRQTENYVLRLGNAPRKSSRPSGTTLLTYVLASDFIGQHLAPALSVSHPTLTPSLDACMSRSSRIRSPPSRGLEQPRPPPTILRRLAIPMEVRARHPSVQSSSLSGPLRIALALPSASAPSRLRHVLEARPVHDRGGVGCAGSALSRRQSRAKGPAASGLAPSQAPQQLLAHRLVTCRQTSSC